MTDLTLVEVSEADAQRERLMFLINNTSTSNISEKAVEIKPLISTEDDVKWFSEYIVEKRAIKELNFHPLYIDLLTSLKLPKIFLFVTESTYSNIRTVYRSPDVLSEANRKILRNLGSWLGAITIGINKPIVIRELNVIDLLVHAWS
jgi:CCR4-NOT transcription complex subunit 1